MRAAPFEILTLATLLAVTLPVMLAVAGRRPAVRPVRIAPERREGERA